MTAQPLEVVGRRERPHPTAQYQFTDVDGHRFQVLLTGRAWVSLAERVALDWYRGAGQILSDLSGRPNRRLIEAGSVRYIAQGSQEPLASASSPSDGGPAGGCLSRGRRRVSARADAVC